MKHNLFSLKLFGHPRHIPAKIPGCPATPAQKFSFPGFRRTYRTFGLPPHHVEDPHPTGRYPDPKVWVCARFSCLLHSFGSFCQFSLDLSVSVNLVNFGLFYAGHARQKRTNFLQTGRWGETTPKHPSSGSNIPITSPWKLPILKVLWRVYSVQPVN